MREESRLFIDSGSIEVTGGVEAMTASLNRVKRDGGKQSQLLDAPLGSLGIKRSREMGRTGGTELTKEVYV